MKEVYVLAILIPAMPPEAQLSNVAALVPTLNPASPLAAVAVSQIISNSTATNLSPNSVVKRLI